MADYTPQKIVSTGLTPAYVDVASSDRFVNNPRSFLHVKNGGGVATVVSSTAQIPTSTVPELGDVTIADISVSIAAAGEKMIFFPPRAFSPAGRATVNYSAIATVTAAVFVLPRI